MKSNANGVPALQIGQLVIAIADHSALSFRKDEIAEIQGIKRGCSHNPILIDIGHRSKGGTECSTCKADYGSGTNWYCPTKFKPYEESDHLSELTAEDILNEQYA